MSEKPANVLSSETLSGVQRWVLPEIDSNGNILSSAEKEAREKAARDAEVIEEIDEEEVTFQPITAEELQAITEEAEKSGFDKGYQDGLEKGYAEGHQQGTTQGQEAAHAAAENTLQHQVDRLLQIAEQLIEPIGTQQQQLETLMVQYISTLTRQLVGRELKLDSSMIVSIVQKAVAALPVGTEQIRVRLNPDDCELVQKFSTENSKEWLLIADASIAPGGCKVESEESLVDYSVEHRVNELLLQFEQQQLRSDSESFMDDDAETVEVADQSLVENNPSEASEESESPLNDSHANDEALETDESTPSTPDGRS